MPRVCTAYGCSNRSNDGKKLSYHRFPLKDKMLLKQWLLAMRRANFVPNVHSRLCSEHFEYYDFQHRPYAKNSVLNPDAVPSRFTFNRIPLRETTKKLVDSEISTSETLNHVNILSTNEVTEPAETIEGNSSNPLDISMNEKFYLPEDLNVDSNGTKEDKRICVMKQNLMSEVVKRALKKAMLELEIKAANAKKDYYKTKKSILAQTNISASITGTPSSQRDSEIIKSLRTQLVEEELAAKIEQRVLLKELFEAEIQAASSKRNYYELKRTLLLVPKQSETCSE